MAHYLDKQLVAKSFNQAAARYDDVARLQRYTADQLFYYLTKLCITPTTILDLGTGTGSNIARLVRQYPQAHLVALDIAAKMVKQAQDRHDSSCYQIAPSYLVGDAEKLPLASDSVDLVFSNLTLQWCDMRASLVDIKRVLKPQGLLLLTSLGAGTLHELRQCWQVVDDYPHVNTFDEVETVRAAIKNSGLIDCWTYAKKRTFYYDSSTILMNDLKTLGARNASHARRRGLTSRDALIKVAGAYEKWRGKRGLPATYQVIYGLARAE